MAVMREDVPAMESGDKGDFKYADDFVYAPVKVDRVLRDGEAIRLGDVLLTAYLTPGHTRGATTWVANLMVDGKAYVVVFPDGSGFNPGYRLVKDPSYPGIRRLPADAPHPGNAEARHRAGAAQRILRLRGQARAGEVRGCCSLNRSGRLSPLHRRQEARLRRRGRQGAGRGAGDSEVIGRGASSKGFFRTVGNGANQEGLMLGNSFPARAVSLAALCVLGRCLLPCDADSRGAGIT
jgi:hypothetical protein